MRQAVLVLAMIGCAALLSWRLSPPEQTAADPGWAIGPTETAAPRPPGVAAQGAMRPVVLAARRDHALHVFDAATLHPLGYFVVHYLAHRVSARPDGRVLFLAQAETPDGGGCCALFALILASGEMCPLLVPALDSTPSPDGALVFSQRGNTGIDVFDAQTLARQPVIAAPGIYGLSPSPDGRWLFGTTVWQGPSLDVFDLAQRKLVQRLPLGGASPDDPNWSTGIWLGGQFVLYTAGAGAPSLRTVTPAGATLGRPVVVSSMIPDVPAGELPVWPALVSAGERLFLYEGISRWSKINKREEGRRRGRPIHGGIYALDPRSGAVTAHFAAATDLAQVVAGMDVRRLFALDAGEPAEDRPVRLLAFDALSGEMVAERALPDDVWSLATAAIPESLVPRGQVRPLPCTRPGSR